MRKRLLKRKDSTLESSSSTDRVSVGRIGRPHGIRGEVTLVPESADFDRFRPDAEFLTDLEEALVVETVSRYRDKGFIVGFVGYSSREAAETLRGRVVTIPAEDRRSLDEGEFWLEDLVGLWAVDADGTLFGEITAVEIGAGQDRLVVTTLTGDEVRVPFVADLVDDPEGDRIVIRPPEGLFE